MRVIVTGTDTEVGKSVVAVALAHKLNAPYWKLVQSGGPVDTQFASQHLNTVLPTPHTYAEPASPHLAARLENAHISLNDFELPNTPSLVVEGAGGLLVPLNERHTLLDLFERFALPLIIVARSGLGTLNHTLLTLEALRARNLTPLAVVLNGPRHEENKKALEKFGKIEVLELLPFETFDPTEVAKCLPFGER